MKISVNGISIIKKFEGFSSKPYLCPGNVWTIGYGHTGKDVVSNMHITREAAELILLKDVERFEECIAEIVVASISLTQYQFDALVSLAYNIGNQAIKKSSLIKDLNVGNYKEAANHFLDWTLAGGKTLAGLFQRRLAEKKLFLTGITGLAS
jgi:GH24 family phage-related lysozyme (muramidase)